MLRRILIYGLAGGVIVPVLLIPTMFVNLPGLWSMAAGYPAPRQSCAGCPASVTTPQPQSPALPLKNALPWLTATWRGSCFASWDCRKHPARPLPTC